jgi:hypothetical protein
MLHTLRFFSKCRLFHNVTFLVPVLLIFYIERVLKFKCKNSDAKRLKARNQISLQNYQHHRKTYNLQTTRHSRQIQ